MSGSCSHGPMYMYTFDDELSVRAVTVDICASDTLISARIIDLSVVQSQCSHDGVDAKSRVAVTTEFQAVLEPPHDQRRQLAVVRVSTAVHHDRHRYVHRQITWR